MLVKPLMLLTAFIFETDVNLQGYYFVSLDAAIAKAWEFVSKAYKKYSDQYEERYRDIGYTTPPKFEEIDNGFRATSWDTKVIYQCTVECIYPNREEGD